MEFLVQREQGGISGRSPGGLSSPALETATLACDRIDAPEGYSWWLLEGM